MKPSVLPRPVTAVPFVTANPGRVGPIREAANGRQWDVRLAADRAGALEQLGERPVDVIVVDLESSGDRERLLADGSATRTVSAWRCWAGAAGAASQPPQWPPITSWRATTRPRSSAPSPK